MINMNPWLKGGLKQLICDLQSKNRYYLKKFLGSIKSIVYTEGGCINRTIIEKWHSIISLYWGSLSPKGHYDFAFFCFMRVSFRHPMSLERQEHLQKSIIASFSSDFDHTENISVFLIFIIITSHQWLQSYVCALMPGSREKDYCNKEPGK